MDDARLTPAEEREWKRLKYLPRTKADWLDLFNTLENFKRRVIQRRQMESRQKPIRLHLRMETRSINLVGILTGERTVVASTKLHSTPNKWYDELKAKLREIGFTVDDRRADDGV